MADSETHTSRSVADTERFAADLAATLVGGTCIALEGDLGAGKTQFVRGLVRGLGGDPRAVSSPTYVLLHVYGDPARPDPTAARPRLPVFHLDAYRVGGPEDLEAIGFTELLDQGGVVVVEWASRVTDLLPPDRLEVTIEAEGETTRRITVRRRTS
ncbi:MAG TPA: tRNA (adenosine(37)-N6)-threonylcarbamoyltransferase complex ATPase subunit type 1 TsaE [Humisphaera sp.]